ncbi:MAG: Fic family protein [Patescibacteria group bacterium]|nr:Fic family protein [Patescibacteria group bacterium]MBU2456992.1 Fic family protein [Patescibacteria group bacterium]
MKYLETKIAKRLEEKLKKLNSLQPLPKSAVTKLQEQLRIEMTYNSNAIEGNSLTLKETFLIINEGITVKGKPLKDHLEAKDHYFALQYLYDLVEKGKRHTISEHLIRTLHQLIMQETDKEWAGVYRNSNVIIGGSDHTPPDALDVPQKMRELVGWIKENKNKLHIIELSALLHHKLVHIHPFFDGNGRTSRIMMNLILMQNGFPLVIILKNDRKKYYNVLDQADKQNYQPLTRFIAQAVERSLNLYSKILTPITKKREQYFILSKLADHTPYSAKYLNLLIRQGKLEAHKEGRVWLTSKEAINRYIKNRDRKRK